MGGLASNMAGVEQVVVESQTLIERKKKSFDEIQTERTRRKTSIKTVIITFTDSKSIEETKICDWYIFIFTSVQLGCDIRARKNKKKKK